MFIWKQTCSSCLWIMTHKEERNKVLIAIEVEFSWFLYSCNIRQTQTRVRAVLVPLQANCRILSCYALRQASMPMLMATIVVSTLVYVVMQTELKPANAPLALQSIGTHGHCPGLTFYIKQTKFWVNLDGHIRSAMLPPPPSCSDWHPLVFKCALIPISLSVRSFQSCPRRQLTVLTVYLKSFKLNMRLKPQCGLAVFIPWSITAGSV